MRNLFKPIITVVCLLLTMSAFGQESVSESERLASEKEIYNQLREEYLEREEDRKMVAEKILSNSEEVEYYVKDARNGLRLLNLDASEFTEKVGDIGGGSLQLFLYSTQYMCEYMFSAKRKFEHTLFIFPRLSIERTFSLSCFDKEDNGNSKPSLLSLTQEKCFSCD